MNATLSGKRKLLYLWKEQNGQCPRCNQKITPQTGWHNHPLVERSKGGSDKAANRVLLSENRVLDYKTFERLEPCAGKLVRMVRTQQCALPARQATVGDIFRDR